MTRVVFAVPGDLATVTGGYEYARRLFEHVPRYGVTLEHVPLSDRFPNPSGANVMETRDRLIGAALGADALMVDGLAYGALPVALLRALPLRPIALVHHPLALETGWKPKDARRLAASERAALAWAAHVIVPSRTTANTLKRDYGVHPAAITVAPPGTEPAKRACGGGGDTIHIVSVGAVVARKGFDVLVDALSGISDRRWRLTIAGGLERAPDTVHALRARIEGAGLGDRIHLADALDRSELDRLYNSADLFALSSRHEGYGMVFAEALARGIPVVGTRAGAIPEVVPAEAGILVDVDDTGAFADALRKLIGDETLRARMAHTAWRHATALPRWEETAAIVAHVLRTQTGQRTP